MAFCTNCGAQVSETARFCTSCGASLAADQAIPASQPYQQEPIQQPVQDPYAQPYQQAGAPVQDAYAQPGAQPAYQQNPQGQPMQPQYAAPAAGAAAGKDYTKLGGWLLFFVILWGLGGLSDLSSLVQLIGSLGSLGGYALAGAVGIVSVALSLAICIIMVWYIIQRNQSFLRMYQILTIAEIVVAVIYTAMLGSAMADSAGTMIVSASSSLVGGIVGLCLMTLYFCKSVRVRTYMGSTEYLNQALFKLGAN